MSRWHFYHKDTGAFSGKHFSSKYESDVAGNTPIDHIAIQGIFDYLSQCVDIETGKVIEFIPDQPSGDHSWNGRRWTPSPDLQKRLIDDRFAKIELEAIDRKLVRYLAEDKLGILDADGEKILADLVESKKELREKLISQKAAK